MKRPLKHFGVGSMADRQGYTLPILTGLLEDMANHEEERLANPYAGRLAKRYDKVMEAIQLLNEACDEEYDPS